MELSQSRSNAWSAATYSIWLVRVLLVRGDNSESEVLLRSLLDVGIQAPHVPFTLVASTELAILHATTGRVRDAMAHLARCRQILGKGEDWRGLAGRTALAEAVVAVGSGDLGEAGLHFDRAIATFQKYSLPWDKAEALHLWGRGLMKVRRRAAALDKFEAALEIYRRHGAGQAWIDRVEADAPRDRRTAKRPTGPDGLSEREVEVLRLVAAGRSNRQISDEMGIELSTVQHHVSHVLSKTGLANRTEAAAYAHRNGLS
jgi:DNA-binding CsgD family transcriptional regulator